MRLKSLAISLLLAFAGIAVGGPLPPMDVDAHGVVDQANEDPHDVPPSTSVNGLDATEKLGQEFTPQADTLVAVDLKLVNQNPADVASVLVRVRKGPGFGGEVVAETTSKLPGNLNDWLHFDFPSTSTLTPGQPYVLSAIGSALAGLEFVGWWRTEGDHYKGGQAAGFPASTDFLFRTYAASHLPQTGGSESGTRLPLMGLATILAGVLLVAGGTFTLLRAAWKSPFP